MMLFNDAVNRWHHSTSDTWMNNAHWWNDTERVNQIMQKKIRPSATVSTTNPTWNGLGLKPGLCGEGLAANCITLLQNKFKKFHVRTHLGFSVPSNHEHSIHSSDTARSKTQINEAELVHVNVCLKHTDTMTTKLTSQISIQNTDLT